MDHPCGLGNKKPINEDLSFSSCNKLHVFNNVFNNYNFIGESASGPTTSNNKFTHFQVEGNE